MTKDRLAEDIKLLGAWAHWRIVGADYDAEEKEFAQAVKAVVDRVVALEAKVERLQLERDAFEDHAFPREGCIMARDMVVLRFKDKKGLK